MKIIFFKSIQNNLKQNIILTDDFNAFNCENLTPKEIVSNINLVAGMDISASRIDEKTASVAFVLMDFKTKEVLYEKHKMVTMTQPYVPGFLAFREVDHLIDLINELKIFDANLIPDVIIVDGNGIYHSNGFGLACHLGVLSGIPCLGCGKTTFFVDGLSSREVDQIAQKNLSKKGEYVFLQGKSGAIHGAAMRCSAEANNNLIISQGHKISLETCCLIVKELLKFKVVEPVRLADKLSREQIRQYEKKFKN